MTTRFLVPVLATALPPSVALAKDDCPTVVWDAALKAHPDSKISKCKEEREKGKTQYEIKLDLKDGSKLELDLSPEGSILQTEEKIGVDAVPKDVTAAFASKFATAKASRAEKQTRADGTVTYELAFEDKGGKHEATFSDSGKFLEQE